MKKRLAALAAFCALLLALSGCAAKGQPEEGLRVVATLFPQYDFAREIAGERAQLTLLLPPGVESHSYEPTPADILELEKADLFLYTGEQMEPWAARILEGLKNERLRVVDVAEGIPLLDSHGQAHEGEAEHGMDPHVWTSPVNAQVMVQNIAQGFSDADPEGAPLYAGRAESYCGELSGLDEQLRALVKNAKRDEVVFAGRFAFRYLFHDYGLRFTAAYDSCSDEAEPNARAVAEIVDKIRTQDLPAIYYEELIEPRVARTISEETGAEMLLLHSCHNLSRQEMEAGETYLSLMGQNIENLAKGLE